jgi:hypothetical protein
VGDTAVIGAEWEGAVFRQRTPDGVSIFFVRSETRWAPAGKATPLRNVRSFGQSVALSRDTALIGARWPTELVNFAASAYVFVRSGTSWTQQAQLTAAAVARLER